MLKFAESAMGLWSMRPIWVDIRALLAWRLVGAIWMLTGWWWMFNTSHWRDFRIHESLAYLTFPWKCCFTRRIGSRSLKIEPMLPSLQGKHNPDAFYWYSSDLSLFNFNVCLIRPPKAFALAGLRLHSRMATWLPFRLMCAYSVLVHQSVYFCACVQLVLMNCWIAVLVCWWKPAFNASSVQSTFICELLLFCQ